MAEQKEALVVELERQYVQEKELRESLELEQSVREGLSNTLYRDHDVASALQRTVNGLGPALRADRALVRIMENKSPGTIISEWLSPTVKTALDTQVGASSIGELRTSVYLDPGPIRDSILKGTLVAINDVSGDERLSEESRATVMRTGLGAFLAAPVIGPLGTEAVLVAAMEGHARNWTDRDAQVAQTMASGLAATLTAIRLYEQERTNLAAMKKLDESKDFFLAAVSHELRTPLTSIVGYLELLQEEMEEGKISRTYSRMLDAIDRNSKRLMYLIENILTASRIESGNLQLSKARTHITPILMRTAETVMPQINSKHIHLKMNLSDGLPDLEIDAGLIEQVILNILSNAIKFTPDGGTISVTASSESKTLAVSISDSGTGIEPDELQKLFTKFYRTSAARDNAVQGTGLGLVIVKAIIEQHGGSVSLSSKVGEGTTFTIHLPTIESDEIKESSISSTTTHHA
jgi:signal transduction histidine kinase